MQDPRGGKEAFMHFKFPKKEEKRGIEREEDLTRRKKEGEKLRRCGCNYSLVNQDLSTLCMLS